MGAIGIGMAATDRPTTWSVDYTYVLADNPANDTGSITTVEIWANTQLSNCEVATFYVVNGDNLSTRGTEALGTVSSGSKQTFSGLDMDVSTGDYLGIYFSAGAVEGEYEGYTGFWREAGNQIPCANKEFTTGTPSTTDDTLSLYGTGTTPVVAPTVTTQAVDDITPTTATGNGTITVTGGENCDKRGVCWNKTGTPTVAGDKSEETDSFGAEAFDVSMAGLDPGTLYYVRAYAHNSAGHGYGSQVEFIASQRISPSAIPSSEAFGEPTVIPSSVVSPSAISSGEAFGTFAITQKQSIQPTGIASTEAFGESTVVPSSVTYPTAIDSAEAFGILNIATERIVSPTGIASAEAFGTLTVKLEISPTGIVSAEAFGVPSIVTIVRPTCIASLETFGTPTIRAHNMLQPSGIVSAEAFGISAVIPSAIISPTSIASAEIFGALAVVYGQFIVVSSIASAEAFGTLKLYQIVTPTGIASAEAFGVCHARAEVDPRDHEGSVGWADEEKSYDNNLETNAYDDIPAASWSDWLTVNRDNALTCSMIRIWVTREDLDIGDPVVEVHRDGEWVGV